MRLLHKFPNAFLLPLVLALLLVIPGCARTFMSIPKDPVQPGARIGVIQVGSGGSMKFSWGTHHLSKAFNDLGLVYVPIQEVDVTSLMLPHQSSIVVDGNPPAAKAGEKPGRASVFSLNTLRGHFAELQLDYVILMDLNVSNNKDYSIKVSLIRVQDMAVVGFVHQSYNGLTVGCIAALPGYFFVTPIVCPAVAFAGFDREKKEVTRMTEVLVKLMSYARGSR